MSRLATYVASTDTELTTIVNCVIPALSTYCTLHAFMRGADGPASTITSATLGAQTFDFMGIDHLTLLSVLMRQFDTFQGCQAGIILAADLPSGTLDATVTRGTATDGMVIVVTFWDDVLQVAPTVSMRGNGAGGDPFNTNITMPTAGTLIDGIAVASTTSTFVTNQTGQVERSSEAMAGITGRTSDRVVSSGSQTMGWGTSANVNRTSHVILGLQDVVSGPTVTQTTDGTDGEEQSFTTTLMTAPITAASVDGVSILADLSDLDPETPTTYTLDSTLANKDDLVVGIGVNSTLSVTTSEGTFTQTIVRPPKTGRAISILTGVDLIAGGLATRIGDDVGTNKQTRGLGIDLGVNDQIYYEVAQATVIDDQASIESNSMIVLLATVLQYNGLGQAYTATPFRISFNPELD